MISRKPTRIELNIDDLEEYNQLKKEQTLQYNNQPPTSASSSNQQQQQNNFKLVDLEAKQPKSRNERIGI
ncbi:subunit of anaphase promoting complex [Cavenderia fasciculata]|uniref:Subunit of anaphase promoting complex n=1 Tax=Cavenderia fasciculata TaxID=261658 RepID=F4QB79_CACFS|nr:subunit of anaphase promoting complex [Cavenderia fasciculata]EGG14851.1 subunit of anaphase promoting complex [Cavenderia fasciculata]|eukprot:XP_004351367.1 subunit of anaphase promoting complex [Cavenderia fasciculata]